MDTQMQCAGFDELTRDEMVTLNGGWGFWSIIGLAVSGYERLAAVAAVMIEIAVGDSSGAQDAIQYYWGT